MNKILVGALEVCDLPDLQIFDLQVRVDTGAKTSSLHVDNLESYKKDGRPWVKFDLHPDVYDVNRVVRCHAEVQDTRRIKSSNGTSEQRRVIRTIFRIGENEWPIELSLSDRSDMSYLMLLGRQGMGAKVLVDPSDTFLMSKGDDKTD